MISRADIVAEARTWIGVKWRRKGRNRKGIDCVGLPIVVGQALGLHNHNPLDYPDRPDGTFVDRFRALLPEKRVVDAKDGDILVFAEGNHPCHAGIRTSYFGMPSVVHSHAGRGKVFEETIESAKSIIGRPVFCFTFNGIGD